MCAVSRPMHDCGVFLYSVLMLTRRGFAKYRPKTLFDEVSNLFGHCFVKKIAAICEQYWNLLPTCFKMLARKKVNWKKALKYSNVACVHIVFISALAWWTNHSTYLSRYFFSAKLRMLDNEVSHNMLLCQKATTTVHSNMHENRCHNTNLVHNLCMRIKLSTLLGQLRKKLFCFT